MTSDDWALVKVLFEEALRREPASRSAWLVDTCAGRPEVRSEVESLLASHSEAGEFLNEPALAHVAERRVGRIIGHYRLTALIGEGGMGAVYRAARTGDFEQDVAIKLSKYVASEAMENQFRKERRILAQLDHPHIARLFDGGTTEDGLSYFIMEMVDGKPLDQYCDANPLSLRDRLRLFQDICAAVQYAHQRLIIHQDLKPGNILVTAQGLPKLLDFGLARVLSAANGASSFKTMSLSGVMTPEYASPEQVRQEPVTTATDVYSLGVILYRLLTGRLPYTLQGRTAHEIEAVVCGAEPQRPSDALPAGSDRKTRRALTGDLDNIVLKAIRKNPQERYASAGEFGDDLQRFLDDVPVAARPITFRYRIGKVAARYKAGVAAALLAIAALLAGLAGTLWQAHVARVERQHAERRFRETRQLAESLLFEIHDSIQSLPGATSARMLVVNKALRYLDNLAKEDRGDLDLRTELAAGYIKIGEIQGMPGTSNLGDSAGAVASFRKSIALIESILRVAPESTVARRQLATATGEMGRVLSSMRKNVEAADSLKRAFAIRQELYAADPNDWRNMADLGTSHWELAVVANVAGDNKGSLEHRMQAVKLWEAAVNTRPDPDNRRSLALMYKSLGSAQMQAEDWPNSLANLGRALAIEEELMNREPDNAVSRMALSTSYVEYGGALAGAKKLGPALEYYKKSLVIRASLAASDSKDKRTLSALSHTQVSIADLLITLGRGSEALLYANQGLAIQERQARDDPENASGKAEVSYTLSIIARAYCQIASTTPNRDRKIANLRSARPYYGRAGRILEDLRAAGRLEDWYKKFMNEIERQAADCDRRIAQLTSTSGAK